MQRLTAAATGLAILVALSACSGGGSSSPTVPQSAPTVTPIPITTVAPIAPSASSTPGSAGQTNAFTVSLPGVSAGSSITNIGMTILIADGGSQSQSSAKRSAQSDFNYVSPLTNSMSVAFGASTPTVYALGPDSANCTPIAGIGRTCNVNVQYTFGSSASMLVSMFPTKDASGTPLSVSDVALPSASSTEQKLDVAAKPVLDALSASIDANIEPGEPSTTKIRIHAYAPGGSEINLNETQPVDKAGKPVTISVAKNDTSGAISLGSTDGGTGEPISFSYSGNLPLAKTTVSITAKTGTAIVKTGSLVVANPKPSSNFSFSLGDADVMDNNVAQLPSWLFPLIPDMKFSVVHRTDGKYLFFWNLGYASLGTGPQPEAQNGTAVEAYAKNQPWEAAGAWFLNVFPKNAPFSGTDTNNLISLYHAESAVTGFYDKTMAVSYSSDGGATWTQGKQIITPPGYPTVQEAGYTADSAAMWDPAKKQWVVFYSPGNLTSAISTDLNAAPGSWKKFYNGSFSEPGLGGKQSPIASLTDHHFSSPAVSWNSYLQKWVMLMDGHPGIWLSTSNDLYSWSTAQQVTDGKDVGADQVGYATLIGRNGDKVSNEKSDFYYGKFAPNGDRVLMHRTLTFHRND